MVSQQEIEWQLKRIGASFRYWGRWEMLELKNILIPGEQIQACLNGRWEGGFAMLCATDQRILLIDKKPLYLSLEDIRYDMVSEVDYSYRLFDATVRICTPNKNLMFMGWNRAKLRTLTNYVQQRVLEMRQQHQLQQTLQAVQQPGRDQTMPQLQPLAESDGNFAAFPMPRRVPAAPIPPSINPYLRNLLVTRHRSFGRFIR